MATQREIANQMLAQLRILDPSVSAEVGTPERKIIDTVAQALSDAQIDLAALSGSLDVNSKVGTNLDNFLALFGFGRQQATRATGYVTFSRETPSLSDIVIPANSMVFATGTDDDSAASGGIFFLTRFSTTLAAGETSVVVPIIATVAGEFANVPANTITRFAGTPAFGITAVTNDQPTTGGADSELDDALKVRFRETVFRNLAGTADQIRALAVATQFTTKVNVVGPVSRYREYIQVPDVDDTTSEEVNPDQVTPDSPGSGTPGYYTTALSTIPYSQHTYSTIPAFISNGEIGVNALFYREGIDWQLNTTPSDKNHGDAARFWNSDVDPDLRPGIDPSSADAAYLPNVTFMNVYTGAEPTVNLLTPGQVVLFEHSYMSSASRNNFEHNVTNAVDVFIDGGSLQVANTIIPAPGPAPTHVFNDTESSPYYASNYRRNGRDDDDAKPAIGNLFLPLFWQPVASIPDSITVTGTTADFGSQTVTFYRDENYWFVEDVSHDLRGTVRARNGIEWDIASVSPTSTVDSPVSLSSFPTTTLLEITGYTYDQNVIDIQAALESSKQVTTDVLVHKAKTRYFKLDITVMYAPGSSASATNEAIRDAVSLFFSDQYFGNAIQLSDILSVIHGVPGVDNVRWSTDVPGAQDRVRVVETDSVGDPLTRPSIDNDFFLRDDELIALPTEIFDDEDVPGLRIRARAQNTWTRV